MKLYQVFEVTPHGGTVYLGTWSNRARALANCDTDACVVVELDAVAVMHQVDDVDAAAERLAGSPPLAPRLDT